MHDDMSDYLMVGILTFMLGAFAGFMLGHGFGRRAGLREARRPPSPLGGIFCLVGAGAMLLLAIGTTAYSVHFLAASTPTEGVVVEVRESKDKDGDISRSPVYRFHDASGHEFTSSSHLSDGTPYAIGDKLRIRYLASSPGDSRIDSFDNHWFLPLFSAWVAVVMAVVGGILRWHYRSLVRKGGAENATPSTASGSGA
jgi:hypothetical protein